MKKPINFARHSYQIDGDLPLDAQRTLNMFSESAPGDSKAPLLLRHSAGMKPFAALGSGPVRAMKEIRGVLYAVSGGGLYRVARDGSSERLGDVEDDEFTTISGNGSQVAVTGGGFLWVWDGSDIAPVTAPGASSADYIDGFGVLTEPDSGRFHVSNLLDFSTVDALDFATAESVPDDVFRVLVDHREIWLFGPDSIEVWYNSGDGVFPFARANEAAIERGCAARATPAKMDNAVYWLGDDLMVHRADGYVPVRISTHPLERHLYRDVSDEEIKQLRAFVFEHEGHKFYTLRFTDRPAWVYDASTQLWHERGSGLGGCYGAKAWKANCAEQAHSRWLVGSAEDGQIFELDPLYYLDDADTILREMVSPPVHAGQNRFTMPYFSADIRTGHSDAGTDPQVVLQCSDDRGHSWKRERWRSLGARGDLAKKIQWRQLGGGIRERYIRLRVTDPVPVSVYGAYAGINVGSD